MFLSKIIIQIKEIKLISIIIHIENHEFDRKINKIEIISKGVNNI